MLTFDEAHDMAMDLANRTGMEAIALTYYFEFMTWTASFGNTLGTSYVEIRDVPLNVLQAELVEHFSENSEDEDGEEN